MASHHSASEMESASETDMDTDNDNESQMDTTQLEGLDMDETRTILTSMIETCEELEHKPSFQHDEDVELAKQVKQGKIIFESQFGSFKKPLTPVKRNRSRQRQSSGNKTSRRSSESCDESDRTSSQNTSLSQSEEESLIAKTKPSDLCLLFKHTKLCTSVLRKRVARMGAQENLFSIELFLGVQRNWGTDEETENYSVLDAFRKQCSSTALSFNTMSATPCFMGAFNQSEYIAECKDREVNAEAEKGQLATPKPKTTKSARFDKNATVHEQVNASQSASQAQAKEGKETNLYRKALRKICEENGEKEVKLIDFFVNKDSVFESLRNIFGTSFCVRDGSFGLEATNSFTDMKISPCAVKKKIDPESDLNSRSQCVVSFSAADLRNLQEVAEGENAINPNFN